MPLLTGRGETAEVTVDGHILRFEHLDRVIFPDDGITRRDLLNYYDDVADLMLPHLRGYPLTVKRFPGGIGQKPFFQRGVPKGWPPWFRVERIFSEHSQEDVTYPVADNRATLLYLTYLGCIEQHPWLSRIGSLDKPEMLLIDLDASHCPFSRVVEAAKLAGELLDSLGLKGLPKTSGAAGMHVYVPLEPVYSYDEVKAFAEILARTLLARRPDLFTDARTVSKREAGKVYFDYLQNQFVKSAAAPYSVRPFAGAPISAPLAWNELKPGLEPGKFRLINVRRRIGRVGDLFAEVPTSKQRLEPALANLERVIGG